MTGEHKLDVRPGPNDCHTGDTEYYVASVRRVRREGGPSLLIEVGAP